MNYKVNKPLSLEQEFWITKTKTQVLELTGKALENQVAGLLRIMVLKTNRIIELEETVKFLSEGK